MGQHWFGIQNSSRATLVFDEGYLKNIQGDKNRHCYWGLGLGLWYLVVSMAIADWKAMSFQQALQAIQI